MKDDSFEEELDKLYEPLDENAVVTSEEDEEWDYLKGIDMYTIKTTKRESRIKNQLDIIEGNKRAAKLDSMPPVANELLEQRAQRQRNRIKMFNKEHSKQS